jgi:hypothetical protein
VGVASRLAGAEPGVTNLDLDNGYLALGLQVRLIGLLLVLAAAAWAIALAARAARLSHGSPTASLCLAILLFGVVMHLSGDAALRGDRGCLLVRSRLCHCRERRA